MEARKIDFRPSESTSLHVMRVSAVVPGMAECFQIDDRRLTERFRNGDLCFLAEDGGKLLGILWGHEGDCYIRGVGKRLNLRRGEVYLYGIFTLPEARNRNVFNTLKHAFFQYYSANGVTQYCALVAPYNHIMRGALQKVGFIDKTDLSYIRILGMGMLRERDCGTGKLIFRVAEKAPRGCPVI